MDTNVKNFSCPYLVKTTTTATTVKTTPTTTTVKTTPTTTTVKTTPTTTTVKTTPTTTTAKPTVTTTTVKTTPTNTTFKPTVTSTTVTAKPTITTVTTIPTLTPVNTVLMTKTVTTLSTHTTVKTTQTPQSVTTDTTFTPTPQPTGTSDTTSTNTANTLLCASNVISNCTFDDGILCGWTQMTSDNFDWTFQSGPTITDDTGPDNDHTLGTGQGKYLYVESSAPRSFGEYASLVSPVMLAGDTTILQFWYFMYGAGIGSLFVNLTDTSSNQVELYKIEGDHGQKWVYTTISVPGWKVPNDYRIIITAFVGSSYTGDIAIDDLVILKNMCKGLGKYLYIKPLASRLPNEYTNMVSPVFHYSHALYFEFGYYMPGDGRLLVYLKDKLSQQEVELLAIEGIQIPKWTKALVTLNAQQDIPPELNDYMLVITAYVGQNYGGGIAIDDLVIIEGTCEGNVGGSLLIG